MDEIPGPVRFNKKLLDDNFLYFNVVEKYDYYRIILFRKNTGMLRFFKPTISYEIKYECDYLINEKRQNVTRASDAFLHDRNFLNQFNYLGGFSK